MANKLKYYYVGNNPPEKSTKASELQQLTDQSSNEESESKYFNPIFNFDNSFIENLNKIKPNDLAQSEPYVRFQLIGLDGKPIDDLNVSFFQKQLDFNSINSSQRFSDRPEMSLSKVQLTTDLASGYLYYTKVKLEIVVHKPDYLASNVLIGLLFPGMPLMLEYGWNSADEFLNFKNKLLFSVVSYDLNIDTTGQIHLNIEGIAHNEKISSILIGDINEEEVDDLGINRSYKQIELYSKYLSDVAKKDKQNINDYEIVVKLSENFHTLEQRARAKISKRFSDNLEKLINKNNQFIQQQELANKTKKIEFITLHDIITTLCSDTFDKIPEIIPGIKEFQVIYGNFNSKVAGDKAEKSIADFPINYKKFVEIMKGFQDKGFYGITINKLLTELIASFLENKNYWLDQNVNPTQPGQEKFHNDPDIVVNFYNNGENLQMTIIDAKANLPPPTVLALQGLNRASSQKGQSSILSSYPKFPVITLGNANSFIKNISLSQISDPQMKAVLIERMFNNSYLTRREAHDIISSQVNNSVTSTTPVLPLRGNMTVIGHPGWLPFRAFFLSTGVFVIDAIYKISSVTHTLSRDGFWSDLEFYWH